jgi:hypothetical protein
MPTKKGAPSGEPIVVFMDDDLMFSSVEFAQSFEQFAAFLTPVIVLQNA